MRLFFVFNVEVQTNIHSISFYSLWNKLYLYPIFSQAQPFWQKYVSLHELSGHSLIS